MSIFEFVYGFMPIVTGLAVTRMMAGFVEVARNAKRVRFSYPHAMWAWCAFASTIGNWAASWSQRELTQWPAWTLLLTLAVNIGQYVFCAFVTPDVAAEGPIDLVQFHQQKRAGYLLAFLALAVLAIAYNFLFGLQHHYQGWWRDTLLTLPMIASIVAALSAPKPSVQAFAATTSALLVTYYLIVACNIVGR
jgi:hypothetical protein